jgi:hypothetical protein
MRSGGLRTVLCGGRLAPIFCHTVSALHAYSGRYSTFCFHSGKLF